MSECPPEAPHLQLLHEHALSGNESLATTSKCKLSRRLTCSCFLKALSSATLPSLLPTSGWTVGNRSAYSDLVCRGKCRAEHSVSRVLGTK